MPGGRLFGSGFAAAFLGAAFIAGLLAVGFVTGLRTAGFAAIFLTVFLTGVFFSAVFFAFTATRLLSYRRAANGTRRASHPLHSNCADPLDLDCRGDPPRRRSDRPARGAPQAGSRGRAS